MVALGSKSNAAVEATGPMLVAPKKFWKPICESDTPTDDGLLCVQRKFSDAKRTMMSLART